MNVLSAAEFIKDRFYFITLKSDEKPKSTSTTTYFSIDDELVYESFFWDFGPLNLAMLYHYCNKVNKTLRAPYLMKKKIMHYTSCNKQKRVNAAFLVASYAILYLDYTPKKAYNTLRTNNFEPFIEFRDASHGIPYTISLLDCLNAVKKAHDLGFFDFENFDYREYEYYERVEHGDLNWIVPNKFIGFCGPHNKSTLDNGYPLHSPETYFPYFYRHNVTTIIRLNKKVYDANKFINAGFDHKDLYFIDGSTPSDRILRQFMEICEKTDGAIAVHCKAGLGRTGSLIGCYIMKHYKFTAKETIAWIRLCRPGSIIGHQQEWLESKQEQMWRAGEEYWKKKNMDGPVKHTSGIYSRTNKTIEELKPFTSSDNVSGILKKVNTMKLNDKEEDCVDTDDNAELFTQGDRLNRIKAQRRQTRSFAAVLNNDRKLFRSRILVPGLDSSSVLKSGKVFNSRIKSTASGAKVNTRSAQMALSRWHLKSLLAAIPYVNRATVARDSQLGVSCRRVSQRKMVLPSPTSSHIGGNSTEIIKANINQKDVTNILKNPDWKVLVTNTNIATSNSNVKESNIDQKIEAKMVTRGKRSLNLEKDKINARSVKVLRRSHPMNSNEIKKKILMPCRNTKTP